MLINYKTTKGAVIEIKLEGKKVIDLSVNGTEIVKNNTKKYDAYLINGFIVIDNDFLAKKLNRKGILKIEMNGELTNIFKIETAKELEKLNANNEKFVDNCTKSYEHYTYSFKKHMNDREV